MNARETADENESNRRRKRHQNGTLFIVPGRIESKRLKILKDFAQRNEYVVRDVYSEDVTHILTEFETRDDALRAMKDTAGQSDAITVLKTKWLYESVKQGGPISGPEIEKYELRRTGDRSTLECDTSGRRKCRYACERKASLDHKNKELVRALEVLAAHAEYRDDEQRKDYSRNLAFCKAMALLKSLTFEVVSVDQIEELTDIGDHNRRVIQDILEEGKTAEVEEIANSECFQTMKLFRGVYGIGSKRAKKLFESGLRTINDLKKHYSSSASIADERIIYGLAFNEELNIPVLKEEAERIREIIVTEAEALHSGVTVTLTGGFRRGKASGHDADFLLSHPMEGMESGLLLELYRKLREKNYVLYWQYYVSSYDGQNFKRSTQTIGFGTTMDHFEKSFLIFKLPTYGYEPDQDPMHDAGSGTESRVDVLCSLASSYRNWKAVRIDLIVVPDSQFAYALVGWTGNKHLNRSLRHYAKNELNLRLTSHGLWDDTKQNFIVAKTEEEVFSNLKLEYLQPHERNP